MTTSTKRASSRRGNDVYAEMDALRALIRLLRDEGVARLQSGDLVVELGAHVPARGLEDFATTGNDDELVEDDGRFDHVGIRLKKAEPEVE